MNGKITDEALNAYKARVGSELRVHDIFNHRADAQAIERFCDGIGEENPLYRDSVYATLSPWHAQYAPPSFIVSVFPGWILQGLPGVHAFHTASCFEFLHPIPLNAQIVPYSHFSGYREMKSRLGERTILEQQEAIYTDGAKKVYARIRTEGIRVEREDARNADLYRDVVLPHPWTQEELEELNRKVLMEHSRGNTPLFLEQVHPGDSLPEHIRGPLGISDILAYCIGACPVKMKAHKLALQQFSRHPAWGWRDADSSAMEPIFGVHYSQSAAQEAGMPYPFDIGTQRHTWLIQLLTDWIGDYGWLKSCDAHYTGYVFLSDVVYLRGSVRSVCYESNTVTVALQAVNQRGESVMKGKAQVLLPRMSDPLEIVRRMISE